ncbi:MAG: hypothetical protein LBJ14_02065 [Desulfarculales bacterium]|jgi:uncharacterized protein YfaS (alpha-2-macroglobulin family)|nr:hypothetical protein [Desulfarculales bacterium]
MWRHVVLIGLFLSMAGAAQAALTLESFSPVGKVERLSQVVVRFSAPVRPLGDMSQDPAASPLKVSLSGDYQTPPPPGNYRWLDQRTLAYLFNQPAREAMTLYCKVEAGVKSLQGEIMEKERVFTISTPAISASLPARSRNEEQTPFLLGNQVNFILTFNQAVDVDSLRESSLLTLDDGQAIALRISELPIPSWENPESYLSRAYKYEADQKLPVSRALTLTVKPGLRGPHGYQPTLEPMVFSLFSFDPLRIKDWKMGEGVEGKYNPESGLSLFFNNPVSGQALKAALKLELLDNKGKTAQEIALGDWVSDQTQTGYYYLPGSFRPAAGYRLTLAAGLEDVYGSRMERDEVIEFKTGDYYPLFYAATGQGTMENAFPSSQRIWLRNLANFTVSAYWYKEDSAAAVHKWFQENYWRSKTVSEPPAPALAVRDRAITVPVRKNQTSPYVLDLEKLLGQAVDGGIVLLEYRFRDGEGKQETTQRALLQYSDLGISLKYGLDSSLLLTTSLSQGKPLAGVNLTVWDQEGRRLWQGRSDENGLASFPGLTELKPARAAKNDWGYPDILISAEKDGQLAALSSNYYNNSLNYAAANYADQDLSGQADRRVHVVSQLPLYQPGQTVNYLAYVRQMRAGALALPEGREVKVQITDPEGKVINEEKAALNAYGSLSGSFRLEEKARLGYYNLRLIWGEGEKIDCWQAFQVSVFRPPDYKVGLRLPSGDRAEVDASYFFGAPLAGAQVKLTAAQSLAPFSPERLADYVVEPAIEKYISDPETWEEISSFNRDLGTVEGRLDEQGGASLPLPLMQKAEGRTMSLYVRAEVTDLAGLVAGNAASSYIHPCLYYLGIKNPYLVPAGRPFTVDLLAAGADNSQAPPLKADLRLLRLKWDVVRERGNDGFYHTVGKLNQDLVEEKTVDLPSSGTQVEFSPEFSGQYLVAATVRDEQGGKFTGFSTIYLYGGGDNSWWSGDGFSLELVSPKTQLELGESAEIMVKNPFPEALALISVEREGVLRAWTEELRGPSPLIKVPLRDTDSPNIYVGVLLLRGRSGQPPSSGPDLAKPTVRYGNLAFTVKNQESLQVDLSSNGSKFKPGAEVEVEAAVRKADLPLSCQLTLLAVDERILNAAGNKNNYDPYETFNAGWPLKVVSYDLRPNIIEQRFKSGDKGDNSALGGGGYEDAQSLLRQNFAPDVFWLAQGETDSQGKLQAKFKLPDSLTAYRVVALAADRENRFGLDSLEIVASKDLQILPALPAFLTMGDSLRARFMVQNMTNSGPYPVSLNFEAEGVIGEGPDKQFIFLGPNESRTVEFPLSVPLGETREARLTVSGMMASAGDAASFTIPVLPPGPEAAAASTGLARPEQPGQAEVELPAAADSRLARLAVTASPLPTASLDVAARYLREYPWLCLEQRASKAVGLAFIQARGDILGMEPREGEAALLKELLASWADFASDEGQFYLWPGGAGDERYPNPYPTAYVLLANQVIKNLTGQSMNADLESRAYAFLDKALRSSRPGSICSGSEAMMIWMLARRYDPAQGGELDSDSGAAQLNNLLRQAISRLSGQDPFAVSALLLAAKSLGQDNMAAELIARLEKSAVISAAHLHFGRVRAGLCPAALGSELRDNALALYALTLTRPDYPGLQALAVWLGDSLAAKPYINTQEAAYSLLGLNAYLESLSLSEEGAEVKVILAGRELAARSFSGLHDQPLRLEVEGEQLGGARQSLTVEAEGGPIYYTARLAYRLNGAEQPAVNSGFTLSRVIVPETGENAQEGKASLGQVLNCTVTVSVPESRLHVLVFDPLPAGLEPLQATGAVLSDPEQDHNGSLPWDWIEMRRDGLMLYAGVLEPGVYSYSYKLRAAFPGKFIHRALRGEEMYQPEIFGHSPAGIFEVQ